MPDQNPEYELTDAADEDLLSIARYTIKTWGIELAHRYNAALELHFKEIGQNQVRSRKVLKRRSDLFSTHCEHHYIFYLVRKNKCPLILAVFHEHMDLMSRLRERLKS